MTVSIGSFCFDLNTVNEVGGGGEVELNYCFRLHILYLVVAITWWDCVGKYCMNVAVSVVDPGFLKG